MDNLVSTRIHRREILAAAIGTFTLANTAYAQGQASEEPIAAIDSVNALRKELRNSLIRPVQYGKAKEDKSESVRTILDTINTGKLIGDLGGAFGATMRGSKDIELPLTQRKEMWDAIISLVDKETANRVYGGFTEEKLPSLMLRELPAILASQGIAVAWSIKADWNGVDPMKWIQPVIYLVGKNTRIEAHLGAKSAFTTVSEAESEGREILVSGADGIWKSLTQTPYGFSGGLTAHIIPSKINEQAERLIAREGVRRLLALNDKSDSDITKVQRAVYNAVIENPSIMGEGANLVSEFLIAAIDSSAGRAILLSGQKSFAPLLKTQYQTHEVGHCIIESLSEGTTKNAKTFEGLIHSMELDANFYMLAYAKNDAQRLLALSEIASRAVESTKISNEKAVTNSDAEACAEIILRLAKEAERQGIAKEEFSQLEKSNHDERLKFAAVTLLLTTMTPSELESISKAAFESTGRADVYNLFDMHPYRDLVAPIGIVGTLLVGGAIAAFLNRRGKGIREAKQKNRGARRTKKREQRRTR